MNDYPVSVTLPIAREIWISPNLLRSVKRFTGILSQYCPKVHGQYQTDLQLLLKVVLTAEQYHCEPAFQLEKLFHNKKFAEKVKFCFHFSNMYCMNDFKKAMKDLGVICE